jgi:hypothetical protein
MSHIETVVKILGLILIAQIIHIDIEGEGVSTFNSILKYNQNDYAIEALCVLTGILSAMFIGFIMKNQISMNCNLLISSITFMILGTDITLKFFTQGKDGKVNFDLK